MTQNTGLNWQRDDFTDITNPFENDLLNRKPLAEHLTRYIDRLQVGAVLALDARWGEGKTWFVMHWQKYLEQTEKSHKVIYINAFAQDHIDDPFLLIAAELRAIIAQDLPAQKRFTEKVMQVGKVLAPAAYKAAISTGAKWTMGINDGCDKWEKLQEQLIDATSEQVGLWVENQIKEHENNKNAFANFKTVLKELAAKHEQPIVIIIDELDRCNPLFSVRLIERIKHFFDIPNIVFVLVCDKHQLQKTICHQFGYDNEYSEAYLEKFIDFSIKLPPPNIPEMEQHTNVQSILRNLGFPENFIKELTYDICVYATVFNTSTRQLKKCLNQLSLLNFEENLNKNRFLLFKLFQPFCDNQQILYTYICHAFYTYPRRINLAEYSTQVNQFQQSMKSHIIGHREEWDSNFDFQTVISNFSTNRTSQSAFNTLYEFIQIQEEVSNDIQSSSGTYVGDRITKETAEIEGRFTNTVRKDCPLNISNYREINRSWNEYIKTGLNE